jgi:hypothetical protein
MTGGDDAQQQQVAIMYSDNRQQQCATMMGSDNA